MADKVLVVLLKKFRIYNPGEAMGCTVDHGDDLVKRGIARYLEPEEYEGMFGKPLSAKPAGVVLKRNVGSAESGAPVDGDGAVDNRTHALNARDAGKLVAGVEDWDELQALKRGEEQHPDHEGGRAGVLKAIASAENDFSDA